MVFYDLTVVKRSCKIPKLDMDTTSPKISEFLPIHLHSESLYNYSMPMTLILILAATHLTLTLSLFTQE